MRKNSLILCVVLLSSCAPANVRISEAAIGAFSMNGGVVYAGPLTITKGGTYSGNWESQDPNVPAVSVQTSEPVIIENSNIRSRGHLIAGFRNRITIRHVNGYGMNPNLAGRIVGKFVNLEEFKSVDIENNYMNGTSGIYLRAYFGDGTSQDTVKILKNKIQDVNGRQSAGLGYYSNAKSISQAIFFNQVQKIPGVEIAWNQIINEPGKSFTEENINMYISSGTAESPILIHDNYIQGAYNAQPWSDKDYAGGGILLGDGESPDPDASGHTRVYNNQIVNASNHSLSITGGVDNQIYNNRAIYSGKLPDGRIIAHNHTAGSIIWDSANKEKNNPNTFRNNSLRDNYYAITNLNTDGSLFFNQILWAPSCKEPMVTCVNNTDGGIATTQMEQKEYQNWISKLASNNISVGP